MLSSHPAGKFTRRRARVVGAVTVVGTTLAVLGLTATAALAAPVDATATAFQVALEANVNAPIVLPLQANATLADVVAPPDSTSQVASIAAELGAVQGVAADGAATATATSSPTQNQGTSSVNNLNSSVLGQAITAGELTGTATCPVDGAPQATTVVTSLNVLGTPVAGDVDATTTITAPVTVTGVTNAVLNATVVTRAETITADTATATALSITFTVTGTDAVAGTAVEIPLGTITAGNATCQRPAAQAPPTASGLTPPQGPTAGGTTVTVTGSGFVPGQTTVTIDGTTIPADAVTVTSPTTLTFQTPPNTAGPVDVTVTTPAGTTPPLGFLYVAPPTVTGIDPGQGPDSGGTTVTVTGSGFVPGQTTVTIGGTTIPAGSVTVTSPTTLTFQTPPGTAGPVDVTVSTPGGTSGPLRFTYLAVNGSGAGTGTEAGTGTGVQLANTGSPAQSMIWISLLLLLSGAALLYVARRRIHPRHLRTA